MLGASRHELRPVRKKKEEKEIKLGKIIKNVGTLINKSMNREIQKYK
jgi:hypothetical protein